MGGPEATGIGHGVTVRCSAMSTTPGPPILSRRAVLAGLAGAGSLALLGCGSATTRTGSGDPGATNGTGSGSGSGSGSTSKLALQPRFDQNTFVVAGIEQRLVVSLLSTDGSVVMDVPDMVSFRVTRDGTDVGPAIATPSRQDGIPIPYYAVRATVPTAGTYELVADGVDVRPAAFAAVAPEASGLVRPGQALPVTDTPTVADHRGVEPLCTRGEQCPFHGLNLRDALAAGKKVALMVSTPKYCQIGICGPVLDLIIEQAAQHEDVQFVHAEVFARPDTGSKDTAPIIEAMGLDHEPALFVVGADGIVRDRLDFVFDRGEITAALATLAG